MASDIAPITGTVRQFTDDQSRYLRKARDSIATTRSPAKVDELLRRHRDVIRMGTLLKHIDQHSNDSKLKRLTHDIDRLTEQFHSMLKTVILHPGGESKMK